MLDRNRAAPRRTRHPFVTELRQADTMHEGNAAGIIFLAAFTTGFVALLCFAAWAVSTFP